MPFIIYVKDSSEKIIELVVEKSDSIDNLKVKIWNKRGVPLNSQQLLFFGKVLENGKTLFDYDIQRDSTIHLTGKFPRSPVEKQVFVKIAKAPKVFALEVTGLDTISSVKTRIWEKEGILPENQALIYGESRLQNAKTLSDYNVWEDSTLYLLSCQRREKERNHIYIKSCSQKAISLEFEGLETVGEVKAKIQSLNGIPVSQQRLVSSGVELKDGSRTLADYFVLEESILHLLIRTPKPRFRLFSEKLFRV